MSRTKQRARRKSNQPKKKKEPQVTARPDYWPLGQAPVTSSYFTKSKATALNIWRYCPILDGCLLPESFATLKQLAFEILKEGRPISKHASQAVLQELGCKAPSRYPKIVKCGSEPVHDTPSNDKACKDDKDRVLFATVKAALAGLEVTGDDLDHDADLLKDPSVRLRYEQEEKQLDDWGSDSTTDEVLLKHLPVLHSEPVVKDLRRRGERLSPFAQRRFELAFRHERRAKELLARADLHSEAAHFHLDTFQVAWRTYNTFLQCADKLNLRRLRNDRKRFKATRV